MTSLSSSRDKPEPDGGPGSPPKKKAKSCVDSSLGERMVGMSTIAELQEVFRNVRLTEEGEIEIVPVICGIKGCSRDDAALILRRILDKNSSPNKNDRTRMHQFPGQRQRPTRVAKNMVVLNEILAYIPGDKGDEIRSRNAKLSARANAGDIDLRDAIENRRHELPSNMQAVLMHDLPSSQKALDAMQFKNVEENNNVIRYRPEVHGTSMSTWLRSSYQIDVQNLEETEFAGIKIAMVHGIDIEKLVTLIKECSIAFNHRMLQHSRDVIKHNRYLAELAFQTQTANNGTSVSLAAETRRLTTEQKRLVVDGEAAKQKTMRLQGKLDKDAAAEAEAAAEIV